MTIPYTENPAWADGSGGGTPINAAKLNAIEQGITDAHLMPAVRVYHNAAQSLTSGVGLALAFNSERFDQVGGAASNQHDTATNNSRLTCRYAGVYQITANATLASNPTEGQLQIKLNGATVIASTYLVGSYRDMCVSTLYALSVNDYVEAVAYQTSGGAINVSAIGNYSPEFMMVRVA